MLCVCLCRYGTKKVIVTRRERSRVPSRTRRRIRLDYRATEGVGNGSSASDWDRPANWLILVDRSVN